MNPPTYRNFTHYGPRYVRPLRWAWYVTDGIGGPLLLSGHRLTKRAAQRAAARAAATCVSWESALTAQLAEVVARLHADGIDVTARLDRGRVCVRPCCPCSDRDHRRAMAAFLAVTSTVAWEVA